MSGPIRWITSKINNWRKTRQLRKAVAEARRDLDFWMACNSPSGDPAVNSMIDEMRAEARSRIVTI
ncbi:MAG: hypothetical protein WBB94_04310 [Candidatus Saccharimonadaceae bacterium]